MFSKNNGEENSNEDEEEKSNKEGKHLLSKVATVKLPEIENIELKTDMRLPRNYSASGLSSHAYNTKKENCAVEPVPSRSHKKSFSPERNSFGEEQAPAEVKAYNSLTFLSKHKSRWKSEDSKSSKWLWQESGRTGRVLSWDPWSETSSSDAELDKRLQTELSCERKNVLDVKKEDAVTASDSKLLLKTKKTDKKLIKREKRKEVQWKPEVDVVYFACHLTEEGDQSGKVLARMVEPLREEWQQERKGLYANMAPLLLESHLKDRWISLLKI